MPNDDVKRKPLLGQKDAETALGLLRSLQLYDAHGAENGVLPSDVALLCSALRSAREEENGSLAPTREAFVRWYDSLPNEERIQVWYECTAMTREEVEAQCGIARRCAELLGLNLGMSRPDDVVRVLEERLTELQSIKARRFPVLGGGMTVPWQMLVPHEPQAIENHDQTLEKLAARGGLGWAELLCVLESRRWDSRNWAADEVAKPLVLAKVREFEAHAAKGT
jgi:hypothetical protein